MTARGETLMELHFCNVCGVSIPNAEVESGEARAEDGDLVCHEHRNAAGSAPSDAEPSEEDLERPPE